MAGNSGTVKDIFIRKSYIVPDHVRHDKKHIYEPTILPLGLYHYQNHPQLVLVRPLKIYVRDSVCGSKSQEFLKEKILMKIDKIQGFYNGQVNYTDELIDMMLCDACFLVSHFREDKVSNRISLRLGKSMALAMNRDVFMLENQIPLWLISIIDPNQSSLRTFLSNCLYGNATQLSKLPWVQEDNNQSQLETGLTKEMMPLHLIDAWHTIMFRAGVETETCACVKRAIDAVRIGLRAVVGTWAWAWATRAIDAVRAEFGMRPRVVDETGTCATRAIDAVRKVFGLGPTELQVNLRDIVNNQYRSVTDLKAKGIRFQKSSNCLSDIKFIPSVFRAELRRPSIFINNNTKVLFTNVIAFEMSRIRETGYPMTSYIMFMKSLIHNANDVKQLRKKRIVYSMLPRDEDVVEIFKDLDTQGLSTRHHFQDTRNNIEKHCNSKRRTWMADLINTYFRSPWAVIALLAATFLLCLTSLQTYFTIYPRNNGT